MARTSTARDTSIRSHRANHDPDVTGSVTDTASAAALIFVVQKHRAHRAGLHWDFRLEHDGVLWSWAVPKGPSLDPADKRMATHVEDHPIEYAEFQGTIPDGQYGAGTVETWDRGTWKPLDDPAAGMRKGELKFVLDGERLHGRFTLVRLKPREGRRSGQDQWLLIKGHDEAEQAGADAAAMEAETVPPKAARGNGDARGDEAPAKGAIHAKLPTTQAPQLAAVTEAAPEDAGWISEIKFDGYRLLAWIDAGHVRLVTRNGLDWTDRLPVVAREVAKLDVGSALLDAELVALGKDGISSFPQLQAALSAGDDAALNLYVFDLLHVNGWDLRPCPLIDRKRVLAGLTDWSGMLRYSDHHDGDVAGMLREACRMHLEGIICKQADAPYRAGRGRGWLKLKCQGREELIVLGWTPPRGSRTGVGALHLGYYDPQGGLHYAGGVGTGFSEVELTTLRKRLDELAADAPKNLLVAGDPLDRSIHWVQPQLVAEVQFIAWSGAGRVRQAVYLGLREDKNATEVVRDAANPEIERTSLTPHRASNVVSAKRGTTFAVPPRHEAPKYTTAATQQGSRIVTARAPSKRGTTVGGVALTHPDKELWPGITKQQLAEYWIAIADHALPGLAHRPLAIVRCPDGIGGEHFFQKHAHGLSGSIREGKAGGSPYLAIDAAAGLVAMAQASAIELHAWGATEAEPLHPDFAVFDLDPGEGVPFAEVVQGALNVRAKLRDIGLESFCRTTGGKGLHIVVPLEPVAEWDTVKPFCRAVAQTMSDEEPGRFLPTLRKSDRRGRILIDWLRNGLGATAVASFCPRARPGANVAMPIAWDDVNHKLDPAKFTLQNVPDLLSRQRVDPWRDFESARRPLPDWAGAKTPRRGRATVKP